uniref:Uncharacterized protein n=1 Tax=Lotharella oceanica TaxID=641309 RepID=A0A7S2XBZ5_9EUKA
MLEICGDFCADALGRLLGEVCGVLCWGGCDVWLCRRVGYQCIGGEGRGAGQKDATHDGDLEDDDDDDGVFDDGDDGPFELVEEEDDDDCEDHMEPMCTDARGSSYGCRYQYSSA